MQLQCSKAEIENDMHFYTLIPYEIVKKKYLQAHCIDMAPQNDATYRF